MKQKIFDKYLPLLLGAIIIVPFKLKPLLVFLFFIYALWFFIKENKKHPDLKKVLFISLIMVPYGISLLYSYNINRGFTYLLRNIPILILPLSFSFLSKESFNSLVISGVTFFTSICSLSIFSLDCIW